MLETALGSLAEEGMEFEQHPPMNNFGDYHLLEEIGRGGQGVVYRARQRSLNRVVALKMIGLGRWASAVQLKRFRLEAEGAASLDIAGIVPIYEIGEQEGACYYTMKLIEGGSFDATRTMPARDAAEIVAKLAHILHHAHERGILHRDIKPSNILFDSKGEPHLTDFGLARLVESETELTQTDDVLGTPSYMAPEQASGRTDAISSATDVYGLGAVLYQLLTGRPPFFGKTKYEISQAVIEATPRSPRLTHRNLDRDLETICLTCLEKEPLRRYPSALALAEDLERWLRQEPIKARPAGIIRRGYKFLRRNPVVAASALTVLLAAVILLGAREVAREKAPTADATAFEFFSRGRNLFLSAGTSNSGKQDMIEAASLFNQALARDPSFFQAYCQLAAAHSQLYILGHDHSPERLSEAEAAVEAALRLRPEAGEAHLARALILYRGRLDYEGAMAELALVARSMPNDPRLHELRGYLLRRMGKREEGLRELKRAAELDPRNTDLLGQINISYTDLRRYAEAEAICDRILAINPNDVVMRVTRASLAVAARAETKPWHDAIESVRANNPAQIRRIADSWVVCALFERDPAAARQALIAAGDNTPINSGAVHFNRPFAEAIIARLEKDETKARASFLAARAEQEKAVIAQPDYAPALCVLGVIDAGLSRKDEALAEGRRAVGLLPPEKDALIGPVLIYYQALIAAWSGDRDLAVEELEQAIHHPGVTDYGELKLSPFWDPMRGDPRFQAVIASFAPK